MTRKLVRWLPRAVFTICVCLAPVAATAAEAAIPVAELAPYFKGGKDGYPYTLAMLELGMRTGAATTAVLRGDTDVLANVPALCPVRPGLKKPPAAASCARTSDSTSRRSAALSAHSSRTSRSRAAPAGTSSARVKTDSALA